MTKVFHPYPKKSTFLPAPGHDGGTGSARYRVARGVEEWGDESVEVLKVQIEYDRVISGRKSPSYPIEVVDRGWGWKAVECKEFDEVVLAAEALIEPVRSFLITWDREPNTPDISKEIDAILDDLLTTSAVRMKRGCRYKVPCRSVRIAELEGTTAESWGLYFGSELKKLGVNAASVRLTIVKIFGDPFVQNPIKP